MIFHIIAFIASILLYLIAVGKLEDRKLKRVIHLTVAFFLIPLVIDVFEIPVPASVILLLPLAVLVVMGRSGIEDIMQAIPLNDVLIFISSMMLLSLVISATEIPQLKYSMPVAAIFFLLFPQPTARIPFFVVPMFVNISQNWRIAFYTFLAIMPLLSMSGGLGTLMRRYSGNKYLKIIYPAVLFIPATVQIWIIYMQPYHHLLSWIYVISGVISGLMINMVLRKPVTDISGILSGIFAAYLLYIT